MSFSKHFLCLAIASTLLSCKTSSEDSTPQAVTDFGVNDKKLQNELLPGDSKTEKRNAWWIDNDKYTKNLFAEFGGPDQVIDDKSEKQIAEDAISSAHRGQDELNGGSVSELSTQSLRPASTVKCTS